MQKKEEFKLPKGCEMVSEDEKEVIVGGEKTLAQNIKDWLRDMLKKNNNN